jgi:DNA-binding response OmpR family regulator
MNLQVVKTDLIRFIKGLVLSFSSLAERKKITLNFKAPDKFLSGYIDHDKIEKIITNLLSNAFKFTPENGEIIFDCGLRIPKTKIQNPKSKILYITISNTGPGIPPDRLDKIFNRFYQADTTYKKDSEGTGIGLALTKELVELHHGTINVESRRGLARQAHNEIEAETKTVFTVNIPTSKDHFKPEEIVEEMETADRRQETEQKILPESTSEVDAKYQIPDTKEQSESSDRSPTSGLRLPLVLIVEDNPDVTTYIRSFLDQDYRIITASNGKEGWQKALAKYPDLIISDVMMPEMDGFELCKKIKTDQRTSHIPVILLTAKTDLNSKIEGLEFGADDYISKPFEADELKVRSKNLIEQRNRLREKFTRMIEIKPGEVTASSMDEQFLERLITVSEKHLSESGYSTENLAREVGVSRSQLNRKLRALTDLSTHGFILNMRLKRAAQLLKMKAGSVSEVAYTVGFNSPANFSKAFKNQYGKSPRDFV